MQASRLTDLVAQAYEAACDLDGMSGLIRNLAEFFDVEQAAIIIWPLRNPDQMVSITHRISPEEIRRRFEYRHQADSLFGRLATLPAGETFTLDVLLGGNVAANDPVPPRAIIRTLAGVSSADDMSRCCILLFRDADQGDFGPPENDALRSFMGYLDRAVALNKRFIDMAGQYKTARMVVDSAPRGIVAIGQAGQIVYSNDEADRILSERDGLYLSDNSVNFRDGAARKKFTAFIESARQHHDAQSGAPHITAVVRRMTKKPAYQMLAYGLAFEQGKAALNENEALAVLIIQDPASNIQVRVELLQTFYNLSLAEARLAAALYKGSHLTEAAASLHISVNTARSQLRGIFKKVGVNSQATLLQELTGAVKDTGMNSRTELED